MKYSTLYRVSAERLSWDRKKEREWPLWHWAVYRKYAGSNPSKGSYFSFPFPFPRLCMMDSVSSPSDQAKY